MNRKLVIPATLVVTFIVVLFLATLWQPERQIRLHQRNLVRAVEVRKWNRVAVCIADNYSDRWEHDKEFVLRRLREVFGQFIACKIDSDERSIEQLSINGVITERLLIQGTGGPLAQLAVQRVNSLAQPFRFHWRRQSWKPWHWQLTECNQPELEIPD